MERTLENRYKCIASMIHRSHMLLKEAESLCLISPKVEYEVRSKRVERLGRFINKLLEEVYMDEPQT